MFTSKQYRDKAAEYKQLTDAAITLNEKREYQNLEQRFTTLADNEQWMVDHREQIVHAQADCAGELPRPASRLAGDARDIRTADSMRCMSS
jgi:hypothetical protein